MAVGILSQSGRDNVISLFSDAQLEEREKAAALERIGQRVRLHGERDRKRPVGSQRDQADALEVRADRIAGHLETIADALCGPEELPERHGSNVIRFRPRRAPDSSSLSTKNAEISYCREVVAKIDALEPFAKVRSRIGSPQG